MEALSNQPGLVSRNGTITIQLKLKHPLTSNQIKMRRSKNKGPGLLSLESLKFSIHSLAPHRIFSSNLIERWFSICVVNSGFITKFGGRLGNPTFGPGLHRMAI